MMTLIIMYMYSSLDIFVKGKTSVICEAYMYHFVLFSTLVINNPKCLTFQCDIYKSFNLHVYGNNKIVLHLHLSLMCIPVLEDHYFDF